MPLNPLKKEALKLKIGSPPRKKNLHTTPSVTVHHSQRVDKSSRNYCPTYLPEPPSVCSSACWKKLHRHLVRAARRSEMAKFASPSFPGWVFHLCKVKRWTAHARSRTASLTRDGRGYNPRDDSLARERAEEERRTGRAMASPAPSAIAPAGCGGHVGGAQYANRGGWGKSTR